MFEIVGLAYNVHTPTTINLPTVRTSLFMHNHQRPPYAGAFERINTWTIKLLRTHSRRNNLPPREKNHNKT